MRHLIVITLSVLVFSCNMNGKEEEAAANLAEPFTDVERLESLVDAQSAQLIQNMQGLGFTQNEVEEVFIEADFIITHKVTQMNEAILSINPKLSEDLIRFKVDSIRSEYGFGNFDGDYIAQQLSVSKTEIEKLIQIKAEQKAEF